MQGFVLVSNNRRERQEREASLVGHKVSLLRFGNAKQINLFFGLAFCFMSFVFNFFQELGIKNMPMAAKATGKCVLASTPLFDSLTLTPCDLNVTTVTTPCFRKHALQSCS